MEYVLLNKDTPLLQFRIERHEDVVNLTTLVRMDISDLTKLPFLLVKKIEKELKG